MNLAIIAAISENNVIGNKGKIPWHISEDMKRFKELTLNHSVIMGRKTYESLPDKFRPLPNRKNIVISRSFESNEEIYIARNMKEALNFTKGNDSWVIGGESIYNLFLPLVNKMEITQIHKIYDGDAFFPYINWNEWNLINEEKKINEKGISYSFMTYLKQ